MKLSNITGKINEIHKLGNKKDYFIKTLSITLSNRDRYNLPFFNE